MYEAHNHPMELKLEGRILVGHLNDETLLVTLHMMDVKIDNSVCTMISFAINVCKKKRHVTNWFQTISPSILKLPRKYVITLEGRLRT